MVSDTESDVFGQVQYYWGINKYDQALNLVLSELSDEPQNPGLLFALAFTYYLMDQYKEAIAACRDALAQGYDMEEGQILLGEIHYAVNHYGVAESHFLEALRINPQNPETLAVYSLVMLETRNTKKAKKLLDQAMEIDPNNPYVVDASYQFYIRTNKKQKQVEGLNKVMESDIPDLMKLTRIGLFHLQRKDYKEAREKFKEAYLMAPEDEQLLKSLRELNFAASIWYVPMRWIGKIGGPAHAWLYFIGISIVLILLNLTTVRVWFTVVYISYAVYSWCMVGIFHFFVKRRNRLG